MINIKHKVEKSNVLKSRQMSWDISEQCSSVLGSLMTWLHSLKKSPKHHFALVFIFVRDAKKDRRFFFFGRNPLRPARSQVQLVRYIVWKFPSVLLTGSEFTNETQPPVVFLIAASKNQTRVATDADLTAARPKAIDTHHWWNSPMFTGTIF